MIGFCGAPFTLASYMIEGGGSRNYVHTKKMMYNSPADWNELMRKLVSVVAEYAAEQVRAGADVIQIFDSWVGCLERGRLPSLCACRMLPNLVKRLQRSGAPIIYFGTDSATLLPAMKETGAEVIGLDWRIPLDEGWRSLEFRGAVQGNLDPVLLFAGWKELKSRAEDILRRAAGRPGHIFNLGHGILPETPVENVKNLARFVQKIRYRSRPPKARSPHPKPAFMKRIAIIGGGISGLAAAFALEEYIAAPAPPLNMLSTNPRRASAACCLHGTGRGLRDRSRARLLPQRKTLGGRSLPHGWASAISSSAPMMRIAKPTFWFAGNLCPFPTA